MIDGILRTVKHRPLRRLGIATVVVAAASIAFALSASAAPRDKVASANATVASTVTVNQLPAHVRAQYNEWQTFSRLYSNPYPNYKAPAAPYKFCESTDYLGNGWEIQNEAEFKALVAQYQQHGLARGGFTVVNSNASVPVQIGQLNSLMAEGCNVIFTIPASDTALCPTFDKARARNILIITDNTPIYCSNVMNSSFPWFTSAEDAAGALAKSLGGKGDIVILTGIPGAVGEPVTIAGFMAGLKPYPGVHVEGQVAGNWTDSIAQSALTTFLATHPSKIDGILDGGDMSTGAELAVLQSGRPVTPESSYDLQCATMALWKQHPGMVVGAQDQGPLMSAFESFLTAELMLSGQKPIVNTLLYPIPGPTQATFSQWYKPYMTVKSNCYAPPPQSAVIGDSYYKGLFVGGHAPKFEVTLNPNP